MRLVTRSDFDGLICAVLLRKVLQIDAIQFVHPKDMQDGNFTTTEYDVLANVPFVPGCGLWFDHHITEVERVVGKIEFKGECKIAPSAARVIYDYYGGKDCFGDIDEMMTAVDKVDSAQFMPEEVLNPKGWTLLAFIMDARTGLGRFKEFRISNFQLTFDLIDACAHMSIDQMMEMPDVQERVKFYFEQDVLFQKMLKSHTKIEGNVIVTDLRGVDPIHAGNRFMIYALYPEQNLSIWIVDGLRGKNCVFACGHSVINRSAQLNVGALMSRFGGGGHEAAGTCQVAYEEAEQTLKSLIEAMCGGSTSGGVTLLEAAA